MMCSIGCPSAGSTVYVGATYGCAFDSVQLCQEEFTRETTGSTALG